MQQLLTDLVQLLALFECGGGVGWWRGLEENPQHVLGGDPGSGSDLVGTELGVAIAGDAKLTTYP